jgi:hypothetical protein
VLAVDLVAVADDAVVQPIEPVAAAVDLNGALLLRCLLPAAPGDRSAEAVLVALAAPNPLDLLDLQLRLGLLGLLDLLGLAVAKMADAHRLASAGLDDGLDAGRTLGPLNMHTGRVVARLFSALWPLRLVLRLIFIALGTLAVGANAAVARLGIGRGRHQ